MRKRSKYKPKPIRVDVMDYVKSGLKKFDEVDVAVDLRIRNHHAMEELRLGRATKDDIDIIVGAFNMVEGFIRLRHDLGRDWEKEIRAGQDALLAVGRRGVETGRFICKAEELVAMNLVMELHDAQLDKVTIKEMEQAMEIVHEDFRTKRMRVIKQKEIA